MFAQFSYPWLLLALPAYSVVLYMHWWSPLRSVPSPLLRRIGLRRLAMHSAAVALLIVAAAGLRLPVQAQRQQIAIAADVSSSIFDLSSQTSRLNELVRVLDPDQADIAFIVFGNTAGTERAMAPLTPARSERPASLRRKKVPSLLPDLDQISTRVERNATDVGAGINFARSLFSPEKKASRAILVLSDFRSTRGDESAAATALNGSGIDLLTVPALLGPSSDVHIASLRVPDSAQLGRAISIEVTVASQVPCTVRVAVWRQRIGRDDFPVDFKTVTLREEPGVTGAELRASVRLLDQPESAGIATYTARLSGTDGDLPGDISTNNTLSAAVRVEGPSRWAVLTRAGSTLDRLARDKDKPLGVETTVYDLASLPRSAAAYEHAAGILVDGLSSTDLPSGPVLSALSAAVDSGKALVALGGEKAFGVGGHREGAWERLLPVEMTPEDDRTRSVLFLIDVSKSMDTRMGREGAGVRKIDFAGEQLAQAVQRLKPLDRLGLITFSGSAQLAAPLSTESSRGHFLSAVKKINIEANTDFLPVLKLAADTLKKDDAEEQLVVLLSDGIQTAPRSPGDILAAARELCPPPRDENTPRRTTLFTFGIDTNAQEANSTGEKLLKALAASGGGVYAPEFLKLAQRLEQAFDAQKKEFYVRYESFGLRPAFEHPLLGPSGGSWSPLPFRNRVRAKTDTETLLLSSPPALGLGTARKPDPLLVISGSQWPAASRRAALALSLDGAAGSAFLSSESGRRLLPALLEWTEAKTGARAEGWTLHAEPGQDDDFSIEVRASHPATRLPLSGRNLSAVLTPLNADASPLPLPVTPLLACAPGIYRALVPGLAQGIYRLSIQESGRGVSLLERFVTVPYPAEQRRFGVDRAAMQALAAKAGGASRVINSPADLFEWTSRKKAARDSWPLAGWLISAALALLLAELSMRRS